MKVFYNLKENSDSALALGFFDGIHLAHQQLIKKTVELAKKNNTKSILITFVESPYSVIHNVKPSYITTSKEKIKLIEELGIDELYILDFNLFKGMTADEYVRNVLIKYFNPKFVITGFNHFFGKNKTGNPEMLSNYNEFKYVQITPIEINNIVVSSTNVKKFLEIGEIDMANKFLNRNFSITGKVVKGNQIARQLGYKTANLIWDEDVIKIKYGVYFGLTKFEGKIYKSLINFGIRPSVDKNLKETLEIHLIGFDGDLYDKKIEVQFLSKLRDEMKFSSLAELKNQIDKDFETVKSL